MLCCLRATANPGVTKSECAGDDANTVYADATTPYRLVRRLAAAPVFADPCFICSTSEPAALVETPRPGIAPATWAAAERLATVPPAKVAEHTRETSSLFDVADEQCAPHTGQVTAACVQLRGPRTVTPISQGVSPIVEKLNTQQEKLSSFRSDWVPQIRRGFY